MVGTYLVTNYFYVDTITTEWSSSEIPSALLDEAIYYQTKTFNEFDNSQRNSYIQSLGYTYEEYLNDVELNDQIDKDYAAIYGDRNFFEFVNWIQQYSFLSRSFIYLFNILGFISSLISIILLTLGIYNYYR